METTKIEKRYCGVPLEVRAAEGSEESRTITGYAAVFDSDSVDMGFTERLASGCFDGVIERSDVVALYNHSEEPGVLARSVNGDGTLRLTVDDKGLRCEFDAPHTRLGDDMLESVRRGDIRGMSFAFTVSKDTWEHTDDDRYVRTIDQVEQLYDVSLVVTPAYDATSVEVNKLEGLKAVNPPAAPDEAYYENLKKNIY
ncbi:HK97 family phage prohead protease [Prevotella sp. KH2C16]|uniref:HK97 family phage prohead protease n=1 Tax=Prevotella sp. KH2C16 TaxID=1855325 RepID=UPI0008ED9E57|nr:HK97 family phage prohead protease [Prevotella sp. KH2C16]SFF96593.1 hypothetical protein SAMN05216383_10312 [Prevotella sp. KH2C16]